MTCTTTSLQGVLIPSTISREATSMAPQLAESQHVLIRDMIISKSHKSAEIAEVARCSKRAVERVRVNLDLFGSTKAPPNRAERRRKISSEDLSGLCTSLLTDPGQSLDEMARFLEEKTCSVHPATISRNLTKNGWSRKTTRRNPKARNADLRDYYSYQVCGMDPKQVVFIDESGCDKRAGIRHKGWAPLGVTPVKRTSSQRDRRYQILPAYTTEGVLYSRIFPGTTDSTLFESFIRGLLPHCGQWPDENSVLIMDNASIHHSERIEQMCRDAGVRLLYLPPYSPDLNPIEEFFSEFKAFIKTNWNVYEEHPEQGFQSFLEWCLSVVGADADNAKGRFRHSGWTFKEA